MTVYQISGPARRCVITDRELRPGEKFYSALFDEAGQFVRKDYTVDAWSGPPAGAFAHWLGRIPVSDKPVKPTINDELLLDCFTHLKGTTEPSKQNFRYVIGLLLMRRKRLKFDDVKKQSDGSEILILRDAKSGDRHETVDPRLNDEQMMTVQDEVFRVLGWE